MSRRDDDALSWDGDDDPTLDIGTPTRAPESAAEPRDLPEGWTPLGRGSETVTRGDSATPTVAASPTPTTAAPPRPPLPDASADAPAATAADREAVVEQEGLGTAALVAIGVLGGVYLLFAIGWLIGGLRLEGRYPVLQADAMYQGALWLSVAAPLIWFATTIFATRRTRAWARWAWLIAGVVLLVPWPFLTIGMVAR